MRKYVFSCAVLFFVLAVLNQGAVAQTKTSARTGWWNDDATWVPPGVPDVFDDVLVQAGHAIAVRFPVSVHSLENNGVIWHPSGVIPSSRAAVALVLEIQGFFTNNGSILGYNTDCSGNGNEPTPTSVLIFAGSMDNFGIIRGGDGFSRGNWTDSRFASGGEVFIVSGMVTNNIEGSISGGNSNCGMGNGCFGGRVVILANTITNGGTINGGAAQGGQLDWGGCCFCDGMGRCTGGFAGGVWFMASEFIGDGGTIDVVGGETCSAPIHRMIVETISLDGPGTMISGATVLSMGPEIPIIGSISLENLDEDAIKAVENPLNEGIGGIILMGASQIDLRNNTGDFPVIFAEPDGGDNFNLIWLNSLNILTDEGVTVEDLTDPDAIVPPPPPLMAELNSGRQLITPPLDEDDPIIILQPSAIPDTNFKDSPGNFMASPGDTMRAWIKVFATDTLPSPVKVTISDSLGYFIVDSTKWVYIDSNPSCEEVRFDLIVPELEDYGALNRLDFAAEYTGDPSIGDSITVYGQVAPTVCVYPPVNVDYESEPVRTTFYTDSLLIVSWCVRNEGDSPANIYISAHSREGWEISTEFSTCYLPSKSDTLCEVRVTAPPEAVPGDVDSVSVIAYQSSDHDNGYYSYIYVEVVDQSTDSDLPAIRYDFDLEQNHPNPFNPQTTIQYTVGKSGPVRIEIFDINGRRIKSLVDGYKSKGSYTITWNGTNINGKKVSSGLYFCRMSAPAYSKTRKVLLLR